MNISCLSVKSRLCVAMFSIASLGAASYSVIAEDGKPIREVLMEQRVELPDKTSSVLVRTMEWPVGYKSQVHTHKGPGPRYVLSGSVRIDDQGVIGEYSAGESFWHAGGIPHTAETIGEVPAKVLIIELLPGS